MQSVRQYNAPHLANLVWFGRSIAAWLQIDDLSDTTSRQHMMASTHACFFESQTKKHMQHVAESDILLAPGIEDVGERFRRAAQLQRMVTQPRTTVRNSRAAAAIRSP